MKQPYLFSSDHLSKILEVTTSVRTKINMIASIGPRLTDPKAKTAYFLGLFRFAEEKSQVEEILKARTQTMNSSIFSKGSELRGAGRGGRGAGGRGVQRGSITAAGRGSGSNASIISAVSAATTTEDQYRMTPNPSTDSYDGGRYLVHGTDDVFADIDKLSHNKPTEEHDKVIRQTPIAMLNASDDEMDLPHISKSLSESEHVVTPIKTQVLEPAPARPEQTSSSSAAPAPAVSNEAALLDKELFGGHAFNTPPSKIVHTNAMNPLANMKKAQEQQKEQKKQAASNTANGERRVTSLRLSSSPSSTVWQANNKEDPSKLVQAGTVLSKLNSFCSGSVPPFYPQPQQQNKSANSTPRNSLGSKGLKSVVSEYNAAVTQSARKPDEKPLPGKLPLSALAVSNTKTHGSPSPTPHVVTPVIPSVSQSPTNNDLAAKCATVLKISRDAFLNLQPEESKGKTADGKDIYSYCELVRRNFLKDYTGVVQVELEKHLTPQEFSKVFEKTMVSPRLCNLVGFLL